MIGVDTNVLVRFILNDDPKQSRRARTEILASAQQNERCYVSIIVLCETVWVLESRHRYSKAELIIALESMASSHDLVFEDAEHVEHALALYRSANADFADILIALRNQDAGCSATLTFDKQAAKLDAFTLLA